MGCGASYTTRIGSLKVKQSINHHLYLPTQGQTSLVVSTQSNTRVHFQRPSTNCIFFRYCEAGLDMGPRIILSRMSFLLDDVIIMVLNRVEAKCGGRSWLEINHAFFCPPALAYN